MFHIPGHFSEYLERKFIQQVPLATLLDEVLDIEKQEEFNNLVAIFGITKGNVLLPFIINFYLLNLEQRASINVLM